MKALLDETRHGGQALQLQVLHYGIPVVRFEGIQQTLMFVFYLGPIADVFVLFHFPAKSLFNVHGFANMVFDKMKTMM